MTNPDFAGQAKGEALESSTVLLAALASAVLVLFLPQPLPRAFRVPGKLLLHPSQEKANKKAWAGCLQDLLSEVLFAHTLS